MRFLNRFFFVGVLAGMMLAVALTVGAGAILAAIMGSDLVKGARPTADFRAPQFPAKVAPDLAWPMQTLEGEDIDLANIEESVVFVNNWATWCGPCVREMPTIEALAERFQDDAVAFVVVSSEPLETVKPYVEAAGWALPIYVTKKRPPAFQTSGIPSTFIFDDARRMVFSHVGAASWDDASSIEFINKLLDQSNP